jgi:hypothetical protein
MKIRDGFVGRFRLVVPWASLNTKPSILELEDVFLIAAARYATFEVQFFLLIIFFLIFSLRCEVLATGRGRTITNTKATTIANLGSNEKSSTILPKQG